LFCNKMSEPRKKMENDGIMCKQEKVCWGFSEVQWILCAFISIFKCII
jgi:hypothetical protein